MIPAPGAGDLLPVILAAIGVAAAFLLLLLFLRILWAFRESSNSLIALFRSLEPAPEITLDQVIPAGIAGTISLVIHGPATLPLERVLIILSPGQGFDLREDHITIPVLGAGERRIFPVGYAPAAAGSHPVRISVQYTAEDRERFTEFTRYILAEALPVGTAG